MWLFTRRGFFSISEHPRNSSIIQIRGRIQKDIDWAHQVVKELDIVATPVFTFAGADYKYRFFIWKDKLTLFTNVLMQDINYSNFKNAALHDEPTMIDPEVFDNSDNGKQKRNRENAYFDVWLTMANFQCLSEDFQDNFGYCKEDIKDLNLDTCQMLLTQNSVY